MKLEIKKYELDDNITKEILEKNNFREGGFMKNMPSLKYFCNKYLIDDVELHIEIGINSDGSFIFDDFDNILVLDESFCQPYYPFYENNNGFAYLNKVILEYNKVMDDFVEKGILKEKQLEQNNDNKKLIK